MGMFPKSVSGRSGKLRENKGDDMAEMTEYEQRNMFFGLGGGCELDAATYCKSVAWGQNRIRQLELENENLGKTILTLSKSPLLASPESEEEIHQRRRRERMLDEITLICVRSEIEELEVDATECRSWGNTSRWQADNICRGINKCDDAH